MVPIGRRIRRARRSADLTQAQLAKATSIPLRTLASYESGAISIPFDRAALIASTLGVSLDELAGVDEAVA